MENKMAHIALAVKSIRQAKGFFEMLTGSEASQIQKIESQNVNTSFVTIGDTKLELLEPIGDKSAISNFIQKRGGGIHHICIETTNFDEMIQKITSSGIRKLGEPFIGAKNKRVIFFHPKDTFNVLVELEER